jgi:hypothetical protein
MTTQILIITSQDREFPELRSDKSTPCYSYLSVVASEEQVTGINRGMKNDAMERKTTGGLRT